MGTRFLLTQDSSVPDVVKELHLSCGLDGTVVTSKVDGMAHRMLRTRLVEQVEAAGGARRLGPSARRTMELKRMSGMTWRDLARDGRALERGGDRSWSQMVLAVDTPMMLEAGLVDGDVDAWVLAAEHLSRAHGLLV